jgi:23S rRNA (uracil1939-C5)-methyltransferase
MSKEAPREQLDLTLTSVAHGGEAIGRAGDLVTFAAYGLPGERVEVELLERKPRFQRGRVTEVLEPAPERATPPCPVFGTCGGCHWQHATYDAQLRFKTDVLTDQLRRTGKLESPPVEPAIPSPLEWHYRNRVQFVRAGPGRLLGFRRRFSHDPIPVEHCYISDPLINRVLTEAPWNALSDRAWSFIEEIDVRVVPNGSALVTLAASRPLPGAEVGRFWSEARAALPEVVGVHGGVLGEAGPDVVTLTQGQSHGDASLEYTLADNRFTIPALSFFQVNLGAAEHLVKTAVEWLAPSQKDQVVDAYGGAGTFSMALAPLAGRVTLIEVEGASVDAAPRNAALNGVGNLAVMRATVERGLSRMRERVDLLLLDPPRRGCGPDVVREILRLSPRRIAYVSCEPSTLARDLRQLTEGGYRLVKSRVVDMFPQTYHLESVSLLEKD